MTYTLVCAAGTFDRFHAGHEALLTKAFMIGEAVLVGMTSDTYTARYKKSTARPYKERLHDVIAWLETKGYADRVEIAAIDDPHEPAASEPKLDAIVVSEQTRHRAEEINELRTERGLPPAAIIRIPMVAAEDRSPISASRIRQGVIDREGRLILPDALRDELVCPLGPVLDEAGLSRMLAPRSTPGVEITPIITVGDHTTKTVLDLGVTPALMVVDNMVRRKPYTDLLPVFRARAFPTHRVTSGPGYISGDAMHAIGRLLSAQPLGSSVLEVLGEEDLLTLPVIAEAPIGSTVLYGQPPVPAWACGPVKSGIVHVAVSKDRQTDAHRLLGQFISSGAS